MSKLSFRARALDASKPMPIYMAEELPDLPDYSVINRAVPQMPSGMEKEEECEHHLQRAICTGLIIPTPEVSDMPDKNIYDRLYPANYKQPRQLIHMQPFTMEQDIPDYDMDSDDERWLSAQSKRIDIKPLKFEEMMDRLEKSSGQTVVSLNEAKALLKEEDDLIIAVFDYWLNKRLKLQHPLLLAVKTEHRAGTAMNNPYIAFRRRTEKMQTRKNRKNDETSYEKMLKLRRDLSRAVTLLELVRKRERMKRDVVQLTVEAFEKRFHAKDFSGAIAAEFTAQKAPRPAFTQLFQNNYANHSWAHKGLIKEESIARNPKRPYKKRKHKAPNRNSGVGSTGLLDVLTGVSSDDDAMANSQSPESDEPDTEGMFAFRRNKNCSYHMPLPNQGNWPWCAPEENGAGAKKYRYTLASLSQPQQQCIGFARRRLGRGGRVIIDRLSRDVNDFWRTMDYTVYDSSECCRSNSIVHNSTARTSGASAEEIVKVKQEEEADEEDARSVQPHQPPVQQKENDEFFAMLQPTRDWLHFRPKTPPLDYEPVDNLLPIDTSVALSANSPFSLELKALDDSDLFTESTFMTAPFLFDADASCMEVPVTDTRQSSQNSDHFSWNDHSEAFDVVSSSSFRIRDEARRAQRQQEDEEDDETMPCGISFTSPKLNSINVLSEATPTAKSVQAIVSAITSDSSLDTTLNNSNGIVTQFIDGNRARNHKLQTFNHPYARPLSNNSMPSSNNSTFRNVHHSAALKSHSTSILEIPMSNDTETAKGQRETGATSPNSKTKAIVRKNLVMEVT